MQAGAGGQGGARGAGASAPAPARAGAGRSDSPPERVPLEAILRGRQEVIIQHRNEEYRLRITSNGKLLLTK